MSNLTHGTSSWAGTQTQQTQQKTYTFDTEGKYVDKNIALTVRADDASVSLSGAALTHGDITTTDTTYLTGTSTSNGYAVTFRNQASVGAVSATVDTAGWVDDGDIPGIAASSTDTKTLTKYVKKGSAAVSGSQNIPVSGQITANGGTITASLSGSKSITGSATAGWVTSVSAATVSASGTATVDAEDLDSNLTQGNIIPGVTIFGKTGTGANATAAQYTNAPLTGKTYVEVSGPQLTDGYLYISDGYVSPGDTDGVKISLGDLIPEDATIEQSTGFDKMLMDVSAYDKDGNRIVGQIATTTATSGIAKMNAARPASIGTRSGTNYNINIAVDVDPPALGSVTQGTSGSFVPNNTTNGRIGRTNQTVTGVTLPAATISIDGGGLTAGAGYASAESDGDLELLQTGNTGDYSFTVTGRGTVNRAEITASSNKLGIVPSGDNATSSATSATSNDATKTYYVHKSTITRTTVTPAQTAQVVTVRAGYCDVDRNITIEGINTEVVDQGEISAEESAITSITATAGTALLNTTSWTYTIPMNLSASGMAYANVETNGYVTSANNASKALSATGLKNIVIPVYDGTYTVS